MTDEGMNDDPITGFEATRPVRVAGPSAPHLLIVAADGTPQPRSLPSHGALTIGRGADVDIHLDDRAVSRRHARLEITGAGELRLTDLNSENGTRVGSALIRDVEVSVRPGEFIMIGHTILVIHGPCASGGSPQAPLQPGPSMVNVDSLVAKAAPTLISVLLLGETGVGKGVMAERIHRASTRAGGPFLQLNCAGLSAALLESELFGHERGAFTGATQARKGLLEEAAGGTVFLDEIGEMPLEVQAHLLLAIDQRVARRVGANRSTPIDVRFISATHRNLAAEIRAGRFRADFYYRINGLTIRIPPLRERRDEIEGLILQFASDAAARLRRDQPPIFAEDARERLQNHHWPGNIRELRSVIESAVLFAEGNLVTSPILTAAGLAAGLSAGALPAPPVEEGPVEGGPEEPAAPGGPTLSVTRERVTAALSACGGNQSRAARLLRISRNTLIRLIRLYNLPRPRGEGD